MATKSSISGKMLERGRSTYANQPVLLNVWKSKRRSLSSFPGSDNHETSSRASADKRFSTRLPKLKPIKSRICTKNVTTWMPLELYRSMYLFKYFLFAPSHPNKTTVTTDPLSLETPISPPVTFLVARCHENRPSFESDRAWSRCSIDISELNVRDADSERRNPKGFEFRDERGKDEDWTPAEQWGFLDRLLIRCVAEKASETDVGEWGRLNLVEGLRVWHLVRNELESRRLKAEEPKMRTEASMAIGKKSIKFTDMFISSLLYRCALFLETYNFTIMRAFHQAPSNNPRDTTEGCSCLFLKDPPLWAKKQEGFMVHVSATAHSKRCHFS